MKFNSKSFIMGIIIGALVFSSIAVAFAANYTANLKATYRDIKVYVNGDQIDYYASNGTYSEPFIINGTTYVPLRLFSEKTGNTVKWDGSTSSIFVLDKEHSHDMDLTPEMAIDLVYNYGNDENTTLNKATGKIEQETSKGYIVSFYIDAIGGEEVTDVWISYYYFKKENGYIELLTEGDRWYDYWFDWEAERLTDDYYRDYWELYS